MTSKEYVVVELDGSVVDVFPTCWVDMENKIITSCSRKPVTFKTAAVPIDDIPKNIRKTTLHESVIVLHKTSKKSFLSISFGEGVGGLLKNCLVITV